ncbi:MAG: MFS transporter [Bacteroidales bacterium]|nr:MFS transporter [Bacteroidales bacterium]
MNDKNWQKYPVLFSLYIAQSIPMSFFSTVVPVIMRQENYSLESIGLLQLVKLPWIFKFLWAPLVDNRAVSIPAMKKWVIMSELFYAVVILGIGLLSLQTDFRLIVVLMVAAFIASATQDIATDKYAIRILRPSERSLGNSMQSAGSFVGTLFGTGVLLIAYHYFGWHLLLSLLAIFVIFAIAPLVIYRKEDRTIREEDMKRTSMADLFRFFRLPGIPVRIVMLVFYYSGLIGILAMLKPFMVDLGFSVREIGFISGILGSTVAALSAIGSGHIVRIAGRRRSLILYSVLILLVALYFFSISAGTPARWEIYLGIIVVWGTYGLSTVAIYTVSMDAVRKGCEGTDFTLQIVITHLSGMIVAIGSGKVGDVLGYRGIFGLEAALAAVSLLIVIFTYSNIRKDEPIEGVN